MSASLVGSEMCIRDRGSGKYLGPPPRKKEAASLVQVTESAENCWALLETCLLYTSDAADDM
eukprot:9891702-Alexandrium_andersonii.AAC.1